MLRPGVYICLLLFVSCNSKNEDSLSSFAIEIPFKAESKGQRLTCESSDVSVGLADTEITLKDFRFYVHGINVFDSSGIAYPVSLDSNSWQLSDVALLDFQNRADSCTGEEKEINDAIVGQVATNPDNIRAIEFTIGIPADYNHANPALASSPLNITSMFWSWQTGYKFMRIDVAPKDGIVRPGDENYRQPTFNFHLGSTGCIGNPELGEVVTCQRDNRAKIKLSNFMIDGNHYISIDYANLVKNLNLNQDEAGAAGCMSGVTDPECQKAFLQMGLDLSNGTSDPTAQQVFLVKKGAIQD